MEPNPTVLKSPFEWPRTPSVEQNRSMSAHEATLKQAESVRNMRKTHREMTSKQQQSKQQKQQRKQHKQKTSTTKTENQKNSRMTKVEIEGDIQVELKDKIEKNIAALESETEVQAQAQVQEQLQLGLNSGEFEVADYIDHTALKAFVSKDDIKNLCEEAIKHNFVSVCVNPVWVEYCSQLLKDTNVKVCTTIGFPLGANTTKMKALEALQAVQDGATVCLLEFFSFCIFFCFVILRCFRRLFAENVSLFRRFFSFLFFSFLFFSCFVLYPFVCFFCFII